MKMPDLTIRGQKVSTDEMICHKSADDSSPVYGQDGNAIITQASFGCNQWKPKS